MINVSQVKPGLYSLCKWNYTIYDSTGIHVPISGNSEKTGNPILMFCQNKYKVFNKIYIYIL